MSPTSPVDGVASDGSITAEQLDELEALARAAWRGPWRHYETMQADNFVVDERGLLGEGVVCGPTYEIRNAKFIAAANPDVVLELIAAARPRIVGTADELDAFPIGTVIRALHAYTRGNDGLVYQRGPSAWWPAGGGQASSEQIIRQSGHATVLHLPASGVRLTARG